MTVTQDTFLPVRPGGKAFPKWLQQAKYRVVGQDNVVEALTELVNSSVVAWDSEYKPTPTGYVVSAFTFSTQPNTAWLLPIGMHHVPNVDLDIAKRFILAISKKRNVTQNGAKAERRALKGTWPDEWQDLYNVTDDIQVIWYLRDPNESKDFKEKAPRGKSGQPGGFSLEAMALKYLRLEVPGFPKGFWDQHSFAELDPEIAVQYACADADVTLRLFQKGMDRALEDSFIYKIEMQAQTVLADMEDEGVWFDKERLAEIERETKPVVDEARAKAYEALRTTSGAVNIDSPTQLRRHLYQTLGWPIVGKRTKDQLGGTDKDTMARLAESSDPEIAAGAQAYMDYKKWFTLWNNFLKKLGEYQNPHTGAIHCSFLSTVVPTGRLACASPNLQQIPRPRKDGRAPLRKAFRARPGKIFIAADYSQIELRVYAGETQENYFFESFTSDVDLHLKTASIIYREPVTSKKDPRRQMGKTMNFGPIYGMKAQGLSMRTDYTLMEAEAILDDFFAAMPDAVKWTRQVHQDAKQAGGVHTHFGRWRPLPWITSRISWEVEFGERSAVNTIVQGTAADIMKIGLIRVAKALAAPDCPFNAKLVLTIHDSVMCEADEDTDIPAFYDFLCSCLCFPIEGYPPLEIDMEFGRNWADMEPFEPSAEVNLPAPETHEPQKKDVVLPDMTPEQKGEFLQLVTTNRAKPNDRTLCVDVVFTLDGSKLDSIRFPLGGYQRVLQFVVATARNNRTGPPAGSQPTVPVVQFA
jgi:DNA polymerase I-like protein with 3'-5' exonuclease and polymerase domains